MVEYPKDSRPRIQWNHVDGPLLICADGTPHRLTLLEHLFLRIGLITVKELDKKHNASIPQRG